MKKVRRFFMIAMLFTGMVLGSYTAEAQNSNPPPPPGGNDGPTSEPGAAPLGGGAPIGGGVAMLLAMGAAYGGKKYYDYRKKLNNEIED